MVQLTEIIKETLIEVMDNASESESWNDDTDIINDIGIDSLQIVRFMMAIEDKLGISIDYEDLSFDDFSSIRALAAFLEKQTADVKD
jgi:acyl carrier protein